MTDRVAVTGSSGRLGRAVVGAAIASSGSAYGTAWSPKPTHPRYVPVDEQHPLEKAEPYGLSKEVDERTAEMAVRRFGMSVAALRFHWIATQGAFAIDRAREVIGWTPQHSRRDPA